FARHFIDHENFYYKKLNGLSKTLLSQNLDQIYQFHILKSGLPEGIINNLLLNPGNIIPHNRRNVKLSETLDDLFILGFEDIFRNLLLVKTDRATMAFSLEGREPLLDNNLMAFAASLPFSYKNNGMLSKRPLREIVYKYLPKKMMDRPKVGFDLPIYQWLKTDLKFLLEDYLGTENTKKDKYFNLEYVQKIKKQFIAGSFRYPSVIWRLMIFEMWHREYFS
ncbi:MAG: hypothetical protein KJZ55_10040, partial [Flavobacteriales bacterium]|nr:hypothetical protein [Flavobacteriales bacterium]